MEFMTGQGLQSPHGLEEEFAQGVSGVSGSVFHQIQLGAEQAAAGIQAFGLGDLFQAVFRLLEKDQVAVIVPTDIDGPDKEVEGVIRIELVVADDQGAVQRFIGKVVEQGDDFDLVMGPVRLINGEFFLGHAHDVGLGKVDVHFDPRFLFEGGEGSGDLLGIGGSHACDEYQQCCNGLLHISIFKNIANKVFFSSL